MNFFFLIENKKIKSKLKIPLFQNSGYFNKNISLFSAKIFNSEWKYEELKIEKFQNFYFIDSNTFSDEEIFFLAETKDFDKSLSINNELFNFNNFTNTSPSFRSNLTINFENKSFSSYQSEYPFHMAKNTGSVLSPLSVLLNKEADINYLIFKNINIKPIKTLFEGYIIDIKKLEVITKLSLSLNSNNFIQIKKEFINENYYFYCKEYFGLPIFLSIKDNHISFEHTQPPQLYFINESKILLKNFKTKIHEKIS